MAEKMALNNKAGKKTGVAQMAGISNKGGKADQTSKADRAVKDDRAGTAGKMGTAGISEKVDRVGTAGKIGTAGISEKVDRVGTAGKIGTAGISEIVDKAGTAGKVRTVGTVGKADKAAKADKAGSAGNIGTAGTVGKFDKAGLVDRKGIFIVMPAFNEEAMVGKVIGRLAKEGYENIIVVDDGSHDRTSDVAAQAGAEVYRHIINRGLGGALGTGIAAAVLDGAEIIVTFDADGQHDVADIAGLVAPIRDGKADVVIGSRLRNPKGMPIIRRVGNWGFNIITFMLFGVWTTDSQSGLRAFSNTAARKINIQTNRMEVSSEIIKEIGEKKLIMKEVPIKAIYTKYSREHGQSSLNAFKILFKLILKRLMR